MFERLGLSVPKKICIRLNSLGYLCKKKIGIRSHGSGYPCAKNLHPFDQLGLSVQKKLSSVQTARAICSKQSLLSAVDFT